MEGRLFQRRGWWCRLEMRRKVVNRAPSGNKSDVGSLCGSLKKRDREVASGAKNFFNRCTFPRYMYSYVEQTCNVYIDVPQTLYMYHGKVLIMNYFPCQKPSLLSPLQCRCTHVVLSLLLVLGSTLTSALHALIYAETILRNHGTYTMVHLLVST